MKVLLIKTHAIGDVLLTTPAIRAIRDKFNTAEIVMLVGNWSKSVLEGNKNIDRIISFDERKLLMHDFLYTFDLIRKLRKEKFFAIIMFHRSLQIHLFGFLIGSKIRAGLSKYKFNPFLTHKAILKKNVIYGVYEYLNVAKILGADTKDISIDLPLSPEDEFFGYKFANKIGSYVCVAPGGGKNPAEITPKQWRIENYKILCEEFIKKWLKIVVIGGNEDKEIGKILSDSEKIINLCGKTTIKQSAAIIKYAKLLITNDSAPLHLGVAMNTPTIGLFGPSFGKSQMPESDKFIYIQSKAKCSPCYVGHRFKGCKNPICMDLISVEEVEKSIEKLLNERE